MLDGLCVKCWVKNDQELKRRAQAQSSPKGRQLAKLLGQALSPAHWWELWDKVKRSRWRSKSQQERAALALQQAEAEFLASHGPGARYDALLYNEELQVGAWCACRVLAAASLLPCVAALCLLPCVLPCAHAARCHF
jgi:hypothetical protein